MKRDPSDHSRQRATTLLTLNKIDQFHKLTASATERNIDIVCIQEHRYYHSEQEITYHDTGNGSASKNSVNAVIGGIGMLLNPRTHNHEIALIKYNRG